jgi:UDP-N-acetylmuramoyl-L-alanyl-D-glutamate--2,6-diaminopimelate ligase
MKLNELLVDLTWEHKGGAPDPEIRSVAYDSRKALPGTLFVCITGFATDGHLYAQSAVDNGAVCLVTEKPVQITEDVTVIQVPDTRLALAAISARWFGQPASAMDIIGVTGTKGKTTTTHMIRDILDEAGRQTGLIGTVANCVGHERIPARRTTPESYDLQELFEKMRSRGVDAVAMEVSSQGLKLRRADFVPFRVGVFTNFSQDHIGGTEHPDLEDYLQSKLRLFSKCETGIVNADIDIAPRVTGVAACPIFTYGIRQDTADVRALNVQLHADHVTFDVVSPWFDTSVDVSAPGMFNVYNALAAIATCGALGIGPEAIVRGLSKVQVPGRAEVVPTPGQPYTLMIDYAHSPDSLENILTAVRGFTANRLICVFGCGGDRDRSKRPVMGEVSGRLADYTVITSDNPRTEDPEAILKDIEAGITPLHAAYTVILDRTEAIRHAMRQGREGDVIVLAGKGHETYQMFKDKTIHYDEREVVEALLKEMV